MRSKILALLFGVMLSGVISTPSKAASIVVSRSSTCEISLSGPIEQGDSQRLENVVNQLVESTTNPYGRPMRLCLDSPGGALEEAARIATMVREWGLATRIQTGDRCLSACAWIFMLGTTDQFWGEARGEYDYVDREMDAGGILGFHAPLLELGDGPTIPTRVAQSGYQALVAAFAEILSLSYNPDRDRDLIDPDLLEWAMRTPPTGDSFYFIDTVDKAGRWNIRVSGVTFPSPLNEAAAENACLNGTAWRVSLSELRYASGFVAGPTRYLAGDDSYEVIGPLAGYAGHECTVSRALEPALLGVETESAPRTVVRGCFSDDYQGLNYCGAIDAISVFPPSTPLSDLSGESGRLFAAELTGSRVTPQAALDCVVGPSRSRVRVVNVNEYVNIRSGPSLQDSIIARANLGEYLTIARPGYWYYETQRGRQCATLCDRLSRSSEDRSLASQVRACIEQAQVWQQVRNSRGQSGYVSVYFLQRDGQ